MDNRTAVTWILTNGCSWTPNSRPREITQNEQRCLSNNQSKLVYSIMYCKSRFFCSFLGVEKGCWFYKSSTMGKPPPRKIELGCIFIGQPQYIPPLPFSIKSESHYSSDGLISVCAVMQRETEYQIGFNINLSWKRCICMKQKTAFHDYSFSDKIFIAAHIGSWVSHEAFLNLMSDFMCEIFTSKFLFLENLIKEKKIA